MSECECRTDRTTSQPANENPTDISCDHLSCQSPVYIFKCVASLALFVFCCRSGRRKTVSQFFFHFLFYLPFDRSKTEKEFKNDNHRDRFRLPKFKWLVNYGFRIWSVCHITPNVTHLKCEFSFNWTLTALNNISFICETDGNDVTVGIYRENLRVFFFVVLIPIALENSFYSLKIERKKTVIRLWSLKVNFYFHINWTKVSSSTN